jgi:hypothetical protein
MNHAMDWWTIMKRTTSTSKRSTNPKGWNATHHSKLAKPRITLHQLDLIAIRAPWLCIWDLEKNWRILHKNESQVCVNRLGIHLILTEIEWYIVKLLDYLGSFNTNYIICRNVENFPRKNSWKKIVFKKEIKESIGVFRIIVLFQHGIFKFNQSFEPTSACWSCPSTKVSNQQSCYNGHLHISTWSACSVIITHPTVDCTPGCTR